MGATDDSHHWLLWAKRLQGEGETSLGSRKIQNNRLSAKKLICLQMVKQLIRVLNDSVRASICGAKFSVVAKTLRYDVTVAYITHNPVELG